LRRFALQLVQSLPEKTWKDLAFCSADRSFRLSEPIASNPCWKNLRLHNWDLASLGIEETKIGFFFELTKNLDLRSKHADFTHKWRLTAMNNNVWQRNVGMKPTINWGLKSESGSRGTRVIYYNFS
jgi:hypothetical protein